MRRIEFTPEVEAALKSIWDAGLSLTIAEKRLGISYTTLYRRTQELGWPLRKVSQRPKKKPPVHVPKIYETTHPLVRQLLRAMIRNSETYVSLAKKTGITREALAGWPKRRQPLLYNFEAALNAMEYELVIRKKEIE